MNLVDYCTSEFQKQLNADLDGIHLLLADKEEGAAYATLLLTCCGFDVRYDTFPDCREIDKPFKCASYSDMRATTIPALIYCIDHFVGHELLDDGEPRMFYYTFNNGTSGVRYSSELCSKEQSHSRAAIVGYVKYDESTCGKTSFVGCKECVEALEHNVRYHFKMMEERHKCDKLWRELDEQVGQTGRKEEPLEYYLYLYRRDKVLADHVISYCKENSLGHLVDRFEKLIMECSGKTFEEVSQLRKK
jgi:hypothetical protein